MGHFMFGLLFIFFILKDTLCDECRETSLTSATRTFTCPGGCCGEIYQRYCCESNRPISIEAIIAGITVAAVLLVGLIIGAFVYLCKKKTPRRVVVYPQEQDIQQTYTEGTSENTLSTDVADYYQTDNSNSTYSAPVKPGYGSYPRSQPYS